MSPAWLKTVPRKPGHAARSQPVCFAQSANALHVMGKGCIQDFLVLNLMEPDYKKPPIGGEEPDTYYASVPAKDLDYLKSLIPEEQEAIHPSLEGFAKIAPYRRLQGVAATCACATGVEPCSPFNCPA